MFFTVGGVLELSLSWFELSSEFRNFEKRREGGPEGGSHVFLDVYIEGREGTDFQDGGTPW